MGCQCRFGARGSAEPRQRRKRMQSPRGLPHPQPGHDPYLESAPPALDPRARPSSLGPSAAGMARSARRAGLRAPGEEVAWAVEGRLLLFYHCSQ